MSVIAVECSDNVSIAVDREMAISMSAAIGKQLESKTDDSPIVLESINSNTLTKVLEFCRAHTSPQSVTNLAAWDEKFVRLEPGELCELASAAYHLEIRPLVDLTCKAIAKLLKGKSPSEIRRTFNILYDFSPGDDVPPPTIRDKLRSKLHYNQKSKDGKDDERDNLAVDTRSVDELLSFINEGGNAENGPEKSSKQRAPKKHKSKTKKSSKLKKSQSLSTDSSTSSLDKSSEENSDSYKEVDDLLQNQGALQQSLQPTEEPEPASLSSSVNSDEQNFADLSTYFNKRSNMNISEEGEGKEQEGNFDPELDREIEEFRMRLESIERSHTGPKIKVPISIESLVTSVNAAK